MKHIQKLVLIPIERWEKIGDKITVKEVTVKSVPQKNVSYQKTHVSQVKRVSVKSQQGSGKHQSLKVTLMFHFLTMEKRKKASKLFLYLTKYKIFPLTRDGELIENGKSLHESNIVELITHAVDNVSSKLVKIKYFYKTLKNKNVPERYISNKIGRKIINKSLGHETSIWRPPGCLNER